MVAATDEMLTMAPPLWAEAARAHRAQPVLDPERRAEHVDVEHPAEVGGLGVDDQAREFNARVVDEDVEPAEAADRRRDGGFPRRLVG